MLDLLAAAAVVQKAWQDSQPVVKEMTMDEWKSMYHYTCSLPTNPKPGFLYCSGPHIKGSDPTTHAWYYRECVQAPDDPKAVDHIPTRIKIVGSR